MDGLQVVPAVVRPPATACRRVFDLALGGSDLGVALVVLFVAYQALLQLLLELFVIGFFLSIKRETCWECVRGVVRVG